MSMKLTTLALTMMMGAQASALRVTSCEEANVNLNGVMEMRKYSNGQIKLFTVDQIEPAAAPVGIAVALDRGDDLSNMESYCRYVWGLSGAELSQAKSKYDKNTNALTVAVPVSYYRDDLKKFTGGTLTLLITKGAAENDIVNATLK